MQIFVKTLTGKTLTVTLRLNQECTPILIVNYKIQDKEGVPWIKRGEGSAFSSATESIGWETQSLVSVYHLIFHTCLAILQTSISLHSNTQDYADLCENPHR